MIYIKESDKSFTKDKKYVIHKRDGIWVQVKNDNGNLHWIAKKRFKEV